MIDPDVQQPAEEDLSVSSFSYKLRSTISIGLLGLTLGVLHCANRDDYDSQFTSNSLPIGLLIPDFSQYLSGHAQGYHEPQFESMADSLYADLKHTWKTALSDLESVQEHCSYLQDHPLDIEIKYDPEFFGYHIIAVAEPDGRLIFNRLIFDDAVKILEQRGYDREQMLHHLTLESLPTLVHEVSHQMVRAHVRDRAGASLDVATVQDELIAHMDQLFVFLELKERYADVIDANRLGSLDGVNDHVLSFWELAGTEGVRSMLHWMRGKMFELPPTADQGARLEFAESLREDACNLLAQVDCDSTRATKSDSSLRIVEEIAARLEAASEIAKDPDVFSELQLAYSDEIERVELRSLETSQRHWSSRRWGLGTNYSLSSLFNSPNPLYLNLIENSEADSNRTK